MNDVEIKELADYLENEVYSDQKKEDEEIARLLQRTHVVDAPKSKKGEPGIKVVPSGYPALIARQKFSFLTSTPFLRVNSPVSSQDSHAQKLEAALRGSWVLSEGIENVWLAGVFDYVWSGRLWEKIYHVPDLWGAASGFGRRDGESESEYLERLAEIKPSQFPIVTRHVDARRAWPTFDAKGELDQVVEIGETTARAARKAYGISFDHKVGDREKVKILDYADDERNIVLLSKGSLYRVKDWEHGLGVNPYNFTEAPRAAPESGLRWTGALFHSKDMLKKFDSLIADLVFNVRRATRAQPIITLNSEIRGRETPEGKPPDVPIKPEEAIILWEKESATHLDPARTNVDAFRLMDIIMATVREVDIRDVLLGNLKSGTTGVLYNTTAQFAQKQYGPDVTQLQKAAQGRGVRYMRAVNALLEGDEALPIVYTAADSKTHRIELRKKDVGGLWERMIQARIDVAIPISELGNIEMFRLATDPKNPALNRPDAGARWVNVEDWENNEDRIAEDFVWRAFWDLLPQFVQQEAVGLASQPADASLLAQRFARLDPLVQQGIQRALPEAQNLGRAAGNVVRDGMQQSSKGMEIETMGAPSV